MTTDTGTTRETGRSADESVLPALLEERVAATEARDARRFLAPCAPDIVQFDLAPPLQSKGAEALDRGAVEAWYATWDGTIEITLTEVEIAVGDDVAFSHSINRMHGTKSDGSQVEL